MTERRVLRYEGSYLLASAKLIKVPTRKLTHHLKQDGPHGTDVCFYCNDFARTIGLLVSPI